MRCAVCPIWVWEDRGEKHLSAVPKSPLLESVTGFVLGVQLSRLLSSDILVCREKLRMDALKTRAYGSSLSCFLHP